MEGRIKKEKGTIIQLIPTTINHATHIRKKEGKKEKEKERKNEIF